MTKSYAPTVEEITRYRDDAEGDFGPLHAAFSTDDEYYNLNFKTKLGLPKEYEAQGVVLPTARSNVDTFADYIDITNARVKVARRDSTQKGRDSADSLQKFGAGLIFMTNVQGAISPWRIMSKHYPLYGLTIVKTYYSADRWPDKPQPKKGESDEAYQRRLREFMNEREGAMPIIIEAVNPQTMYFDTATMGEKWCIQCFSKKVSDILGRYKKWSNPNKRSGDAVVEYLDYWDKDFRCVLIDGEPILKGKVVEHGYGFIPFTLIDAGLGNVDADNTLENRFVGINRYLHDPLHSESRDFSIVDVVVSKNGMPWGVLEGDNAMQVQNFDMAFGTVNRLPQGVKFTQIMPVMAPDQVVQHLGLTREIIEGFAGSRSLRGQGETGVRSGSDRRQILAAAQYRLRYSEMAFKHRTSEVLNKCARIGKNVLSDDVRVFSHTPADEFEDVIDFNKIEEPINFYVDFAPVSEEDEYRRHDDLERLHKGLDVPSEWCWSQISTMNVKDLTAMQLREQLKMSPAFQNALNQILDLKLRAAVQARLGAEGLLGPPTGPPGGTPPQPGGPQPAGMQSPNRAVANFGSAAALQQQMSKNRSQVPMNPGQGAGGGGARGYQR